MIGEEAQLLAPLAFGRRGRRTASLSSFQKTGGLPDGAVTQEVGREDDDRPQKRDQPLADVERTASDRRAADERGEQEACDEGANDDQPRRFQCASRPYPSARHFLLSGVRRA
jgi:hypothetical protein